MKIHRDANGEALWLKPELCLEEESSVPALR